MKAFLALALLCFVSLAQAQYIWVDEKGIKQFSDRPPPPGIPQKNIIKEPGRPKPYQAAPAEEVAPAEAAPAADKAKGPPSLAEREADYKKRQKQVAENQAKQQATADVQRQKSSNCDFARQQQTQLQQGGRVVEYDSSGLKSYVDDAMRARRLTEAAAAVNENCSN